MPVKKTVKAKPKAPRIRVEEITDEKPVAEEVKTAPVEEVKPEVAEEAPVAPATVPTPPRVASFAQLDSTKENVSDESKLTVEVSEPPKTTTSVLEGSEAPTEKTGNEETPKTDSSSMSSEDIKEWLKDVRPDTTKDVEKTGGRFNIKLFLVVLLLFIVLGALAGGVFYYKDKVSLGSTKNQETATPQITQAVNSPTPTVAESVKLSDLKVNILNGSGTPGEAGRVKTLLLAAGFSEDKISTGNADKYTYTESIVSIKADTSSKVFDTIKKALDSNYNVENSSESLKNDSGFDVVVIVGKKK